jgi:hypothetical protein
MGFRPVAVVVQQDTTHKYTYNTPHSNQTQHTSYGNNEVHITHNEHLSAKLVPTFVDRCYVVSATDAHGRILGFLDRNTPPLTEEILVNNCLRFLADDN